MADPEAYLKQWFVTFLKNRDLIHQKIVKIEDASDHLAVVMKDRKIRVFLELELGHAVHHLCADWMYIVTLHNEVNKKALMTNWDRFAAASKLTIFFLNPFSSMEQKWVIIPATHDRICDKASLELGIAAMGELVEPITEEAFKSKLA